MSRSLTTYFCLALGALASACASSPALPGPATGPEPTEPDPVSLDPERMLRTPRTLDDDGIFFVLGEDPEHPRVRYLDGQVSLNETCAIRVENKLNRRIPPVYVNGQPLGFC